MSDKKLSPSEAREILWRQANLKFKLLPNQLELYNKYKESSSRTIVWNCSRRIGKSRTLCIIALEICLNTKNAVVKYLSPTQKMVRTIIRPLMRELIADAPVELRPVEKSSAGIWYFPSTGSQIHVAGCDGGRAENVRGGSSNLCIVDEAGFVSRDLEYIVNSILLPTTSTTDGKIILASTPPKSVAHEFIYFMNKARFEDSLITQTIFDCPLYTKDKIDEFARAAGGYDSITFRREYLAQILTDDSSSVIPEFTEELKLKVVKEWPKPPFYDTYVSMDIGVKDLTVALFAYFDFKANKVIIEDEIVMNGHSMTTDKLAEAIKVKESLHFSDPFTGEVSPPLKRVCDNNLLLIQDLYRLHGLVFYPTKKDDADAAINNLRILLKNENIIINPRCKTLIRHLQAATWNKSRTSYDRSGDDGHYDALDACTYLIRNIHFEKNPYPAGFGLLKGSDIYYNQSKKQHLDPWLKIINQKK